MLELLAPAGDTNSFEAAINCGADAIYLGLSDFNARKKAENFSTDNLREYVRKAHFFGVKVYVTVNTLVYDDEMPRLVGLVRKAVEAKADAFIVQDLGVARVLLKCFPNIVLHASTQLGVHNLYGAKIAEKIGFKRVVLSRETKLEDIREIRKGTSLEIEYFVHGALCVAFSGNCYLSAVEQNASGNRGLCKQLCRLPYTANVGDRTASGYLLSAKDLCLADSLKELAEAGVMSFKIEGRLRREGYVGSAVSIYRQMLNGIAKDLKLTQEDKNELKIAYCRGGGYLERAYLDAGTPSVIEKNFNNHTGLAVGFVTAAEPFKTDLYKVTIKSERPISKGDGLKFFEKFTDISRRGVGAKNVGSGAQKGDGQWLEAASLGIGDVTDCGNGKYIFVTKTRVNVGWAVHLISTMEKSINDKKLAIELGVTALVGKPLSMTATAGDGIKVCVTGDVCERAKTAPVSADDIAKQASKTADSGFYVTHCNVYTDGIFVAKSMINSLRRDLLNSLAEAVISHAESKQQVTVCEQAINNTNDTLTCDFYDINIRFVHSDELNNTVSNVHIAVKNDEVVAICPEQYTVREIKRMVEILDVPYDRIALQLPVIANNMDLAIIGKILEELPEIRTLVSENIYGFAFADKGYKVIAGAGHNVLNAYAKRECEDLGMAGVLPAIESDKRRDLGEELPLMTFAYCPYKTVYGNECDKCSYKEGMTISRERKTYRVRRTRVANCYFGLYQ